MADSGDYDGTTFPAKARRARKPHRCSECRREIAVGETYHRCAGVSDGSAWAFEVCAHCWIATRWVVKRCDGWVITCLLEDLELHHTDEGISEFPLLRLIVSIRKGWRRADGSLMPLPKVAA